MMPAANEGDSHDSAARDAGEHHRPLCDRLREELQRRHPQEPVEVIETHISWVFLAGEWALKLKKPVQFEFLDFSTAQKRREACEEEVRLNRRLANDVYVGVVPVTVDARGRPCLDEAHAAEAMDWVVKMRRLPADRSLDRLLKAGAVTKDHSARISARLSQFYAHLRPLRIPAEVYHQRLRALIGDNRQALLDSHVLHAKPRTKRIHAAQLQFLELSPEIFAGRVESRIVDGHGDLRAEHIYLAPDPLVIDCIEFNANMRQVDVADELAFLEMECEMLDDCEPVRSIASRCLAALGDAPPPQLVSFYKSYRACVRAKVAALRAEQAAAHEAPTAGESSERYLQLADQYAAQLGAPLAMIVRGLMGTGKSTLATKLANLFGAELLQTDLIRRNLLHMRDHSASYGGGIYDEDTREKVYRAMFAEASAALRERISVVLDGTFLHENLREQAASLARDHGARFLIVNCRCPTELVRQRLAERDARGDSVSDARPVLLDEQRADEEPVGAGHPTCDLDTTYSPTRLEQLVLERLRALVRHNHGRRE